MQLTRGVAWVALGGFHGPWRGQWPSRGEPSSAARRRPPTLVKVEVLPCTPHPPCPSTAGPLESQLCPVPAVGQSLRAWRCVIPVGILDSFCPGNPDGGGWAGGGRAPTQLTAPRPHGRPAQNWLPHHRLLPPPRHGDDMRVPELGIVTSCPVGLASTGWGLVSCS